MQAKSARGVGFFVWETKRKKKKKERVPGHETCHRSDHINGAVSVGKSLSVAAGVTQPHRAASSTTPWALHWARWAPQGSSPEQQRKGRDSHHHGSSKQSQDFLQQDRSWPQHHCTYLERSFLCMSLTDAMPSAACSHSWSAFLPRALLITLRKTSFLSHLPWINHFFISSSSLSLQRSFPFSILLLASNQMGNRRDKCFSVHPNFFHTWKHEVSSIALPSVHPHMGEWKYADLSSVDVFAFVKQKALQESNELSARLRCAHTITALLQPILQLNITAPPASPIKSQRLYFNSCGFFSTRSVYAWHILQDIKMTKESGGSITSNYRERRLSDEEEHRSGKFACISLTNLEVSWAPVNSSIRSEANSFMAHSPSTTFLETAILKGSSASFFFFLFL